MHTKSRSTVYLEPILYVKFANFLISSKIAVSCENLGGADNICPTGCLKGGFWENFAIQAVTQRYRGAETLLETMNSSNICEIFTKSS